MRNRKPLFALLVGVALLISTVSVTVAGALITTSGGAVIKLNSPPASVKLNALQNATKVNVFDERQSVTLASAVAVDATAPGTYGVFPNGTATVAAGTLVDSHYIDSDITPQGRGYTRIGSITFDGDIIGVVASRTKLAASDAELGAPGTSYPGDERYRGLEGDEGTGNDSLTISNDKRTLSFAITTHIFDQIRILTAHDTHLDTTIVHSPANVTQGNDVQYTLTVTNNGSSSVSGAHVVDTLPAGTTLKSGPASCTGTTTVDCTLGSLAAGASAQVQLIVTLPNVGTASSSAVASPGTNTAATDNTTVEAPEDGVTKGWVQPGQSLTIPGHDPSTVELPDTGDGAPIVITQGPGTFCAGPCTGATTTVNPFPGYDDPDHPIMWTMTFTFNPGDPESTPDPLTAAAAAYGSTIYKHLDTDPPNVGTVVPACGPTPRVATDYACLDGRAIAQPTPNHFVVSFKILYLSGDPTGGRR